MQRMRSSLKFGQTFTWFFFNKTRQRLCSVKVTIHIFWNDWAVACYQSGFLDACTSLGFCKLQERGAGAWILPENTQVFTNANKSRQPRTGNLRKCINICMYAFQINVMWHGVVSLKLLPKCHTRERFALEFVKRSQSQIHL